MRTTFFSAATSLVLASTSAWCDLQHTTLAAPGGFIQAGCYPSTCGCSGPIAGGLQTGYGPAQDFHEQAFGSSGSGSSSSSYNGPPIVLSINGTAGMGYLRVSSSNTHFDTDHFAAAFLDACWKESFTISNPLYTGQSGYMTFRMRARGSMITTNLTGSAQVAIIPYKDNASLLFNPYSSIGNADLVSTSQQGASWGLASYGVSDSRVVDGFCTFSIPFTFGQPFKLTIGARALTGQRSSGGFGGTSSGSSLDFSSNGITWDGITGILLSNGNAITGSTIASGSSIDWTLPINPNTGCSPADLGTQGGVPGHDGVFDNNDFVVFIDLFFQNNAAADLGSQGGVHGPDGQFDNNDFVAFIDLFFAGC